MAQLSADFELGTNGNDILTTDPGSATAWNTRTVANGTLKYSNAQKAHGTLAMAVDNTGATGGKVMQWDTALGVVTDHYGRFNYFVTAYPASNTYICSADTVGVSNNASIRLNAAGTLSTAAKGIILNTTTNTVPLSTWIRIEFHFIHSATVGQVELKLFLTMDSGAADETITSAANKDTAASANGITFGTTTATTGTWIHYFDDILANATSYPGPVLIPSTVAVVNSGGSSLSNLDRELFNITGPNRQDSFSPMPASPPQQKVGQPRGIPRQNLDW